MITVVQKKLDGLQILRAIAALCVLLQHSIYISGLVTHANQTEFLRLELGSFGVDLFFFISGFMMMLQLNKPAATFALHRFFRIYPPFFLALILSVLISAPVLGLHYFRFHLRLDLLLLPTGSVNPTFNVPYWTLIYEVFFYTLIFAVISLKISRRFLNFLLLVWAVAVLLVARFHPLTNYLMPTIWQISTSPLCIFFIMGSAFGLFFQKKSRIFLGLMALLAAFYVIAPPSLILQIYFLCSFIILFYLALKLDNMQLNKFLTKIKNILIRCGDYSYGLYLLHFAIVITLCNFRFFTKLNHWQLFLVTFTVAGVVGLFYGYVEYNLYSQKFRLWANSLATAINKKISAQPIENQQIS